MNRQQLQEEIENSCLCTKDEIENIVEVCIRYARSCVPESMSETSTDKFGAGLEFGHNACRYSMLCNIDEMLRRIDES